MTKSMVPTSEGPQYLPTEKIDRNPENPRIVFDEKLLHDLEDSINQVGILVPLIVYYDDEIDRYILLDGERRLRCAKALRLAKVPANIISKPSRLQNILQMFNIHNVRIEWGAMEVAWKIQVIIKEFGVEKESELAKLTSLKPSEIRKSKLLLTYDKKYQDLVHKGPKQGGIKEDFLIELKPTLNWLEKNSGYEKNDKNELVNSLIIKHKTGIIDNYVRSFRDLNKIVKSDVPKPKIENIIHKLVSDPKFTIEEAYEESIKNSVNMKEISRRTEKLINLLTNFTLKNKDVNNENLLKQLNELYNIIGKILKRSK